ncbi:MAG TPA: PilZ domain-containing protein, partial [Nitrospirae bacterium]|nr:PilZ domain-containing protein [Nitrospirota bacterium]
MGKGRDKRILMGLPAELVIGPMKNYRGIIPNLSDKGISVIVETSPDDDSLNFPPGAMVQLNFNPRDEKISLNCEIK